MLVVITGPTGLLGPRLVERLGQKHELRLLARGGMGGGDGGEYFGGDITDRSSLRGLCDGADAVLHLAAIFDFDFAKLSSVNVLGTYNVMEEAVRAGAKRFVFFSTGVVYGSGGSSSGTASTSSKASASSKPAKPAKESDLLMPDTAYGLSKAMAEDAVRYHGRLSKMPYTILRVASMYGPASKRGVIHNYVNALLQDNPLRQDGDGKQVRDFIYMEDVADACERVLEYTGKCDTFNLSSGKPTTILELINTIAAVSGTKPTVQIEGAKEGFARSSLQDPSLAKKELGWTTQTSLEDGIAKTLEYFKKRV